MFPCPYARVMPLSCAAASINKRDILWGQLHQEEVEQAMDEEEDDVPGDDADPKAKV